jgi:two-component system sensor histidine kinase HydH
MAVSTQNISKLDFKSTGIQEVFDHCHTVSYKEIQYQKNQNETIPLGISISPICGDDGTCSEAVLIVRDLREIRQLEEKVKRSEKLAAVGQLAAGLAHEIRNPLSSIRGFAQFLRHALKNRPKEQEYAEIMIKEMDRINRVVTDLLSFASPKAAEPAPTDATELVNHVIRLIEGDAQSKHIKLYSHIASDIGEMPLDAYQITQAFLNLLVNSLKFVEKGGRIEIKAFLMQESSQFVFQVEDDGPGIPPENMLKIFDPFFTTRKTGTGLGLAIVHKIVENHQGDIDVDSPPPGKTKGSRFTIRIPVSMKNA